MRKIIIVLVFMLCAIFVYGQELLYEEYKVFKEEGYTYICDPKSNGYVDLYNKSNKWVNTCPKNKNTGECLEFGVNTFVDDTDMDKIIQIIVNNAFTAEQIEMVKEYVFAIIMALNSGTGKVEEAYFRFFDDEPYIRIPVSVFRKIELELKEKVRFQPTDEGKVLDYIYYAPRFAPKQK